MRIWHLMFDGFFFTTNKVNQTTFSKLGYQWPIAYGKRIGPTLNASEVWIAIHLIKVYIANVHVPSVFI